MSAFVRSSTAPRFFQHSAWDGVLVLLAVLHGVMLVGLSGLTSVTALAAIDSSLSPGPIGLNVLVIAVGLWWNSNSISHNFIHNPFFSANWMNSGFAAFLSLLLGFPHSLWRSRHLAHHADKEHRLRWSTELAIESSLVAVLWIGLGLSVPLFFFAVYLPGWLLGLGLCAVQGHYEHARGTVSCYGPLYNLLFFNDGFHVEHHAHPKTHWTRMEKAHTNSSASRWPPVFRWLEAFSLEGLERIVLRSSRLQMWVLRRHQQAFEELLSDRLSLRKVAIVGGGLFPRTALILRNLLPDAELTVIDMSRDSLESAADLMPAGVGVWHEAFDARRHGGFDLLVIPLSFQGDRRAVYDQPAARFVVVHDWLWNRRGLGAVVSPLLFKRLNLVRS